MSGQRPRSLFGVPLQLERFRAVRLLDELRAVWLAQTIELPRTAGRAAPIDDSLDNLEALTADLSLLKYWFDPIASGKRLRDVLAKVPSSAWRDQIEFDELLLRVSEHQSLVTPEGRVVMWAIGVALGDGFGDVVFNDAIVLQAHDSLHAVYRSWSLQRIGSVVDLLTEETTTLRPTAAGLLLVLLVNRNTSPERRLPAPEDPTASAQVSRAIATPALAFARVLSGSERAQERGVDLYRGWAMGEIARRLGGGLHRQDDGIWIDPSYEDIARQRLIDAVSDRSDLSRGRVRAALDAALEAYEVSRPVLSGLGLAHERPSNTSKLLRDLVEASGSLSIGGSDGD